MSLQKIRCPECGTKLAVNPDQIIVSLSGPNYAVCPKCHCHIDASDKRSPPAAAQTANVNLTYEDKTRHPGWSIAAMMAGMLSMGMTSLMVIPTVLLVINLYGIYAFTGNWIFWSIFFTIEAVVAGVAAVVAVLWAMAN